MIYLDNSATTRPFDCVIEATVKSMSETYYNASASYKPAVDVEKEIRACRKAIAAEVGALEDEVYFTAGGTESDNLAILGTAQLLREKSNFLCSEIEHPAVLETIRRVERMGHEVRVMPIGPDGIVDLAACERLIDEHTAFVSCMQVSNETGAIQPVEEIARIARQKNPNVVVHVDGVQGFMRVPIHMGRMGVDLYALSGHKIHGPKGVGALIVKKRVRLAPQMTGGGQEKNLRSGTYNSTGIIGLYAAVREMARRREEIARLAEMKKQLWLRVCAIPGVRVNGPKPGEPASAPHILSLSFDGVRGEVMRNALEGAGILVSTGSACASHKQKVSASLRAMGLTDTQADGTIRVSFGLYNQMDEVDVTAAQMEKMFALLSKYKRR